MKTTIRNIISGLLLTGTLSCAILPAVFSCGDDNIDPEERVFLEQVKKSLENNATAAEKTELFSEAVANDYTYVVELLLEHGADINARDGWGQTPLFYAVEGNHKDIVELLMENGVDINARDSLGKTPLFYAVEDNHKDIVELLMENGVDINARDSLGKTPLFYAVEYYRKDLAELFIGKGGDVNVEDKANRTPLYYAFQSYSLQMIQLLINNKAKVDPADEYYYEKFKKAVSAGSEQVVMLLIQAGVDVTKEKDDGESLILLAASSHNNKKIFQLLIEAGAVVTGKDKDGRTAVMKIIVSDTYKDDDAELVEMLLKAGTAVNAWDNHQQTALMWAAKKGGPKTTKVLLEAGAHVNVRDRYGDTALMYAVEIFQADIVSELIQAGANVNIKNKYGKTVLDRFLSNYIRQIGMADFELIVDFDTLKPLLQAGAYADMHSKGAQVYFIEAAKNGEKEIVRYFIQRGINVNKKDSWEETTALIAAAKQGWIEIGKLLIKAGADVNLKDYRRDTALFYTLDNGYKDFTEILLRAGAKKIDLHARNALIAACETCDIATARSCIERIVNIDAWSGVNQWPPLIIAADNNCTEIVKLLIKHGADVNAEGIDMKTALDLAIEKNYTEVVGLLLTAGAHIKEVTPYDNYLWVAINNDNLEIVQLLVRKGIEIDNYGSYGEGVTPLIQAIDSHHVEIAKYLIQAGADVNYQGRGGKKAIDIAREKGYDEIVALLERTGRR